jgi:hypothetical protein
MRTSFLALAGTAAVFLSAQGAVAQGHVSGAAVGAVVAPKHHRVAGAVVGGAVGHHMAKTRAKKQAAAAH